MAKLSTHVLDTSSGKPAIGMTISLYRVIDNVSTHLSSFVTNSDGRCDRPLLENETFVEGLYELVFEAGDYFERAGSALSPPRFLDRITIAFGVANAHENYHVPLLVSPWAYSTYRGS